MAEPVSHAVAAAHPTVVRLTRLLRFDASHGAGADLKRLGNPLNPLARCQTRTYRRVYLCRPRRCGASGGSDHRTAVPGYGQSGVHRPDLNEGGTRILGFIGEHPVILMEVTNSYIMLHSKKSNVHYKLF
jgi:hypothetical protein